MNFGFSERHKKSQFCETLSKTYIQTKGSPITEERQGKMWLGHLLYTYNSDRQLTLSRQLSQVKELLFVIDIAYVILVHTSANSLFFWQSEHTVLLHKNENTFKLVDIVLLGHLSLKKELAGENHSGIKFRRRCRCWGEWSLSGAPNEVRKKNRKKASNAVCLLISFYSVLKRYLCQLTFFDLFG